MAAMRLRRGNHPMTKHLFFCLCLFLFCPSLARADQVQLSEQEMLHIINSAGLGAVDLYQSKDIPVENRNQFDVNGDGIPEWFIVPKTACGETNNCSFFVIMYDKKNKWHIVLKGDGKLTSLSPWGGIIVPHMTKDITDLLSVLDMGREHSGERILERTLYVWNGKAYEKSTAPFPPPDASPELLSFLKDVDKLKHERTGANKPKVE